MNEVADSVLDMLQNATNEMARLRAENERLSREVNYAKYGNPDFAWSLHQAQMYDLQDENEKLRKALHYYADDHHHFPNHGPWGINSTDFGDVARAALKGDNTND